MADPPMTSSSSSSYTKPVQNRFFKAFASISPTSVLDYSKPFSSLQNPFSFYDHNNHKHKIIPCPKIPIGLALIQEKHDDDDSNHHHHPRKGLIFSAKLRVQIPPPPPDSAVDGGDGGEMKSGLMTVEEMEVCEEYTCVRRHGPNPEITHIFDDFVLKTFVLHCHSSQIFSMAVVNVKKKNNNNNSNSFLSFCYTCDNNLDLADDIYIYRGEKAFCSHECRYQEMVLDEEEDDSS